MMLEGALHVARLPVIWRSAFAEIVAPWAISGVADVQITGADGAMLQGWYVRPAGRDVFRTDVSSCRLPRIHGVWGNRG